MIHLEPMTAEELERFLERSIPEYAADHVRDGQWNEAESIERSREEHRQLLPQGVESPDNFLRTIRDETGRRVGELWYNWDTEAARPQLFIYWIGIDAAYRRRGYGEAAMGLIEAEARRLGAERIALHVFGGNRVAQSLYAKLGYVPTNVLMAKRLTATEAPATPGSPRP